MIESGKLESIVILTGRRMELQRKLMNDYGKGNAKNEQIRYLVKALPNKSLMSKQEKQKNAISKHTKIEEIIRDNPEILNFLKISL